jgi:superfamily I DNA/RNA helicase
MKQHIGAIKKTLDQEGIGAKAITQLKELREWFKSNLNEPGYVKMLRYAYEDIQTKGDYTFAYLEDEDGKSNLAYLLDLLSDYHNKYNKEELQEIRNLMEGIVPEEEEGEEEMNG